MERIHRDLQEALPRARRALSRLTQNYRRSGALEDEQMIALRATATQEQRGLALNPGKYSSAKGGVRPVGIAC